MYSIIELNNKQYKVEEGKPVLVDRLPAEKNQEITIDRILLHREDNGEVKVGTPYVKGMTLKARVLDTVKGKKLRVFKYKKRKRYRRTIGYRPQYTRIAIQQEAGGA